MSDNIIDSYLSLHVPSDYPTIQDALDFLKDKIINADIDILVADGEYEISSPITSAVQQYSRLTIRGNESDCSKCVLKINNINNTDGFLFQNGCGVSWLNGFSIQGQQGYIAPGEWLDNSFSSGIRVINTSVTLGNQLMIDKMYYGIRAMYGAHVTGGSSPRENGQPGGGIRVTNSGDAGFHAFAASLQVDCAEAYDCAHYSEGLGFGFCAEAGGFISCQYSIAEGNNEAGFYTQSGGSMWAHGVSSSNNRYGVLSWSGHLECNAIDNYLSIFTYNTIGIYATYKGYISANRAICQNNQTGLLSDNNSLIDITNMTCSDNAYDGFKCDAFGTITGFNIQSHNNNGDGFNCVNGGKMKLINVSADHNGGHGYYARNIATIFTSNMGGIDNQAGFCSPLQSSVSNTPGNLSSYIINTL